MLNAYETEDGWQYLACDVGRDRDHPCYVSAGQDVANQYLQKVDHTLHDYYREREDLTCYCEREVLLIMSNSENNPGRLYFRCRQKGDKCNFFQWADLAPRGKVQMWLERGSPKHHQPKHREANVRIHPYRKPDSYIRRSTPQRRPPPQQQQRNTYWKPRGQYVPECM